jgi:hypothetical protein
MQLDELIAELEHIREQYGGEVEVHFQDEELTGYPVFFVVPEEYEGDEIINIRNWPY